MNYVSAPIREGHISGWFIDDFWCARSLNGSCTDPAEGPTEVEAHSVVDMGLSEAAVVDITRGWLDTMTRAQEAIVAAGGYTWSLIPGQDNADASPVMLTKGTCAARLREACKDGGAWETVPLLMGLTPGLASVSIEVAAFLAMRGSHAWLGWGEWGLTWPPTVPFPPELRAEYGLPLGRCVEHPKVGVFVRRWSLANVTVDCNSFTGSIVRN